MTTRSKRFRYLALAAFLSIGAGVLWGVASGFSFGILHSIVYSQGVYESLKYTLDGVPVIESYERGNYDARTYRSLDGKPVEISGRGTSGRWPYLAAPTGWHPLFFRPNWSQRIKQIGGNALENWFFIGDDKLHGHGYIVGYDNKSKEKVGYLDRNGFRTDKPPLEEQFSIDGRKCASGSLFLQCSSRWQSSMSYLKTDDGLVHIDLKKRTAKLVRKETDWFSAIVTRNMQTKAETWSERDDYESILLRTSDRVLVLNPLGEEIQTYLLPAKLRNETFSLILLPDGNALVWKGIRNLFWIDTTGKILKHEVVNLRSRDRINTTTKTFSMSLCVPSSGIIGGTLFCYPWGLARMGSWPLDYWIALNVAFQQCWPGLLFVTILGVILAILCYRRQRKYGLEWTWVWTGFVFLFGLPGFLGYLAHRRWPARLPCPSCGKLAPRDREACFSCDQDFPEPTLKGTEVFA